MASTSRSQATSIMASSSTDSPNRKRLSLRQHQPPEKAQLSSTGGYSPSVSDDDRKDIRGGHDVGKYDHDKPTENKDAGIKISSISRQAGQTVAPFLAEHIPQQYNPFSNRQQQQQASMNNNANTKYCYRHRPDLKCRRQANEPSMEQLQNELGALSQSDQQGIAHVWSLFSAAPSKHRNLMLQGILAQCCFPQLSFISSSIRDLIKIDFLSALPSELAFKILCYLDTTSLCKAAQVSQRWRTLADDDVVWHKMCEQHIDRKCTKCGWGLPLLEKKRLRTEKRHVQLRATGRGINEWSPNITPSPEDFPQYDPHSIHEPSAGSGSGTMFGSKRPLVGGLPSPEASVKRACTQSLREGNSYFQPRVRPWKDVYRDRFKVGTNWKYGRCSMRIFKGHTNGVNCLQFDDNILATGSYDSTIKIWDIETGKELRTLTGHTAGIRCLKFDDAKLVSGSIDQTMKVWNWRTGECLRTYTGHSGGIITLDFSPEYMATGSIDRTIRVFDKTNKAKYVLRGHTDWVNSVKIDEASRTLFSASDDCTIRLWDLDTRQCVKVFEGHVGQVQQVLPLPPEFELEDADAEHADDVSDGTHSPTPTQGSQPGVEAPAPSTSTGASAVTCGPTDTSVPHSSPQPPFPWPVPSDTRAAPPRYMLSAALDSQIRLWDVAAGRCVRTFFGHLEGVWALAADTLRVVSGSEDSMVKVWEPRTGRCERTFAGHQGPVTCVGLSDSRMCAGSEDCEVRLYSFKTEGVGVRA